VSHPRISAFAGRANGNAKPVRVIEGQSTLFARTTHDLALDTIHDEIVAPNSFAEAILFFRGGASGEEKPIRIIQGPDTLLRNPDNVAVDAVHNEVFVASREGAVFVYPREANGNVAPIRILQGPQTKIRQANRVAIDSENDLMFVTTRFGSVLTFPRAAQGDTAPTAVISGPKTLLSDEHAPYRVAVYPEGKRIFVGVGGSHPLSGAVGGFVAVWKYGDNGDVPPWALIPSTPLTGLNHPFGGVALNPKAKEIMVLENSQPPGLLVFRVPELF